MTKFITDNNNNPSLDKHCQLDAADVNGERATGIDGPWSEVTERGNILTGINRAEVLWDGQVLGWKCCQLNFICFLFWKVLIMGRLVKMLFKNVTWNWNTRINLCQHCFKHVTKPIFPKNQMTQHPNKFHPFINRVYMTGMIQQKVSFLVAQLIIRRAQQNPSLTSSWTNKKVPRNQFGKRVQKSLPRIPLDLHAGGSPENAAHGLTHTPTLGREKSRVLQAHDTCRFWGSKYVLTTHSRQARFRASCKISLESSLGRMIWAHQVWEGSSPSTYRIQCPTTWVFWRRSRPDAGAKIKSFKVMFSICWDQLFPLEVAFKVFRPPQQSSFN